MAKQTKKTPGKTKAENKPVRNPRPKKIVEQAEAKPVIPPADIKPLSNDEKAIELLKNMKGEYFPSGNDPNVELSAQAKKWATYLPMQGITPERFLEKYPLHVARKYVQEIVDKKNKEQKK